MNAKPYRYHVGYLKKIFPTFVFLFCCFITGHARDAYKIPDFAFPQNVEKESQTNLSEAMDSGNGLMALRYAINLTIARNQLTDSDGVGANIIMMDSVAQNLYGFYKGLALLIEAEILEQHYLSRKSQYDGRNLPLDQDFPGNPQEWSGDMFKTRILQLVESASSQVSAGSEDSNISSVKLILNNCETAEKSGLTVNEFILLKGEKILKEICGNTSKTVIPFYANQASESLEGKAEREATALLARVESIAGDNSVVKSIAMIEKLSFIPDYEKEKYLSECLKSQAGSEGSGIILYQAWRQYGQDNTGYYDDIKNWLKKYPKGFGRGQLEYALSVMNQQNIGVDFPNISLPDTPISGQARLSNINSGYLLVYKLNPGEYDAYENLIIKKFNYKAKPVKVVELDGKGTIPFSVEKNVDLGAFTPGLYAVIPAKSKSLPKGWDKDKLSGHYSTFRVSDLSILTSFNSNDKGSGRVYVVKGDNQQPVEGATVSFYDSDTDAACATSTTNKEGWVVPPSNAYYRIKAKYNGNEAVNNAGFSYYAERASSNRYASILTDLAVYRPGDTVNYVVVGWLQDKLSNSLLRNEKITVDFRDANYRNIATDTLTLDLDGRATGTFVVPEGRLLGRYQLQAKYPDFKNQGGGSTPVFVEEYKLPGFLVAMTQEESGNPEELKFSGIASTYSGMPVADAAVSVKIEYHPWRWWGYASNASYSQISQTDSEGRFELTLPLSNLKGTFFEKGRYTVTAEVTDRAGETEKSTPLNFFLGKGADVRPQIPDKLQVKGDSITFHVPVYDIAGLPQKSTVDYTITNLNDSTLKVEGSFESPSLSLPSSAFPSGKYKFEFKAQDEDQRVVTDCVLWRSDDVCAPEPTPLWVPQNDYSFAKGSESVEVAFGSFWNEWLLCVVSDGENILSQEWLDPSDKMQRKKIAIPSDSSTIFVSLCGLHDFSSATSQITIVPKKSLEKLTVETVSFRDKISAGNFENWKFKFKIEENPAHDVNAMAVMTDKALNAIHDFKWNLNFWKPAVYNKTRVSPTHYVNRTSNKAFTAISPSNFSDVSSFVPAWQTYGYPFTSFMMYDLARPMYAKSMARSAERSLEGTMNIHAAMTTGAMKEEAADDAVSEEAGVQNADDGDDFQFRPVEMPLAFFKPNLKADDNGILSLDFTVPDFNTTWQLQIAGYNPELLSSSLVVDAVASKPVMVKTNLPQFLRTGDVAQISATLFNNSESVLPISGKLEIIDPTTGRAIASKNFEARELEASASRVVTIEFKVPDNISGIVVRSYALGGNHSDGEQGVVAVLPSSTPVTEAQTFWAKSDQKDIALKVAKLNKEANVTLKYCDNPLWEVLLSLPSITESCNSSSLSIAHWLFATVLASDVIWKNDKIATGLKNILESDDASLSMSNLEKDANLKIVALEASPWINTAYRETARIRSLSQYLDKANVTEKINSKAAELKKLQNSDGGWSWFEGMKSSTFITEGIIRVLGYLNHQGILPADLNQMAARGVKYIDRQIVADYEKYKSVNVPSCVGYFYARNMLDVPMDSKLGKIRKIVTDSIVSQWRHWDIGLKAKGAMVLSASDHKNKEAKVITESLKQFLNSRLTLEEEAILLELFTSSKDNEEALETVMEKMMLRKETEDWSSNINNVAVVHALAGICEDGDIDREPPVIYIDAKKIELPQSQQLTGNFTINLDAKKVSGKNIKINRKSGVPAWGGVLSQYVSPIKDVKKADVEDLSIEKRVYKENEDGSVSSASRYEKGDKVVVTLNLTVGRNMNYVVIVDSRAACLQPDDKTSSLEFKDGLLAYREIRADRTSFFIENLPAGRYVISYTCHADRDGTYSLGIAETQCLYSPAQVAHSAGKTMTVISR